MTSVRVICIERRLALSPIVGNQVRITDHDCTWRLSLFSAKLLGCHDLAWNSGAERGRYPLLRIILEVMGERKLASCRFLTWLGIGTHFGLQ